MPSKCWQADFDGIATLLGVVPRTAGMPGMEGPYQRPQRPDVGSQAWSTSEGTEPSAGTTVLRAAWPG